MRYFLTGGTGFIGGRLARQLAAAGHSLTALVRDPDRARDLAALGVTLAKGDVTDRQSLYKPMEGADGVFHVAGWYKLGRRNAAACQRVNVEGTRNVLEVMNETGVPKGVYTSSLAVFSDTHGKLPDERYRFDGPHLTAYDRSKWEAHYSVAEPLIEAGLPLVVVLPGVVYGPGDPSSLGQALADTIHRRLPLVPGGTAYCWAHVEDVAAGHVLAMEKGQVGESYIIAGAPYTLEAVFALAEQMTGIPAPGFKSPPGMMRIMAAVMGAVERIAPLPETYTGDGLRASAGVTYLGDNAKARRELGYAPRAIEVGLRETLEALQEKGESIR
jgi:nucleoside-diphosphate-sugar epimerase